MRLPSDIRAEVEASLGRVSAETPVGGGCVHPAARLELASGPVFVKYDPGEGGDGFTVEAEGLEALRSAAPALRIPRVIGVAARWLALEWLEPGRPGASGERLGRGLAELHDASAGGWGWHRDGYIGPLPQANAPTATWAKFWGERRLAPQLARAREAGWAPGRETDWDRLFERLPGLLDGPARADGPSLLHGDLWSGNVIALEGGGAALVDPAAYRGHGEVDLAMTALFGGFDAAFYRAYAERRPSRPGWEVRRGVYQLYYLLVHVNLFGAGYVAGTERVLRDILDATG